MELESLKPLIDIARVHQARIDAANEEILEIGRIAVDPEFGSDHPLAVRVRLVGVSDLSEFRSRAEQLSDAMSGPGLRRTKADQDLDEVSVKVTRVIETEGLAEKLRAEHENIHNTLAITRAALPVQLHDQLEQLPEVSRWKAREAELDFTRGLDERGKQVLSRGEIRFDLPLGPVDREREKPKVIKITKGKKDGYFAGVYGSAQELIGKVILSEIDYSVLRDPNTLPPGTTSTRSELVRRINRKFERAKLPAPIIGSGSSDKNRQFSVEGYVFDEEIDGERGGDPSPNETETRRDLLKLIQVVDKADGVYVIEGREVTIPNLPANNVFIRAIEDLQGTCQGIPKAEVDAIAAPPDEWDRHTANLVQQKINRVLDRAFQGQPPFYFKSVRMVVERVGRAPMKRGFYGFSANGQWEEAPPPDGAGDKQATGGSQESGEKKDRPVNSFVEFIGQNGQLAQFCDSVRRLRQERQQFFQSPEFKQLAENYGQLVVDIGLTNIPTSSQFNPRAQRQIGGRVRRLQIETGQLLENVVFGPPAVVYNLTAGLVRKYEMLISRFERSMDPIQHRRWDELERQIEEFSDRFDAQIQPSIDVLGQSKQGLYSAFREYMAHSYKHMVDFSNFLRESEYGSTRDQIRPFLVSITNDDYKAERDVKLLDITSRLLKDILIQNPQRDLLETYLGIVSRTENSDVGRMIRFALRFAHPQVSDEQILSGVNLTEIIDALPIDTASWDDRLSGGYRGFISNQVDIYLRGIRESLWQYKQDELGRDGFAEEDFPSRKGLTNGHGQTGELSRGDGGFPLPEDTRDILRPAGVFKNGFVQAMSEDELLDFCRKAAGKLARGNKAMLDDVVSMVNSLRRNPVGLGTEKLTDQVVRVGHKRLPVHSFDPRQREDLKGYLKHELSPRVRVSYIIQGEGNESIIGILRIQAHDDADKDYMS